MSAPLVEARAVVEASVERRAAVALGGRLDIALRLLQVAGAPRKLDDARESMVLQMLLIDLAT